MRNSIFDGSNPVGSLVASNAASADAPGGETPHFESSRDGRVNAPSEQKRYGPFRPQTNSPVQRRAKQREDTIIGCESLAASDLARAALMDTENGRRKLEYSAASWQQRASLLRSLEARTHKRMILDKTEWDQADADERLYPSDQDIDDVRV